MEPLRTRQDLRLAIRDGITVAGQRRNLTGLPLDTRVLMQVVRAQMVRSVRWNSIGRPARIVLEGNGRLAMVWTWDIQPVVDLREVLEPVDRGNAAETDGEPGVVPTFPNRSDAETWLGLVWRTLSRNGALTAQLTDDGDGVGRPLSLVLDES